ncbi:hypothetical protein SUGI_1169660 [Cryptomeria japonica]|nr:hypothetical protein SUGI_1169660 [Cryptomeria japonica]
MEARAGGCLNVQRVGSISDGGSVSVHVEGSLKESGKEKSIDGSDHGVWDGRDSRSDIGSAFIRFERESGRFYSDKGVHELFVSLILAGKDTITPGLTWFFWLVANNPRVEAQILAELREIVKQRKSLHDQDPFSFSFEEVKSMAYLHATVTESLRLYPPIPLELTASLVDDVLPDGTPMKKGEQILYSIYSSGRLGSVWGEDCLEFKPERWMKNGRFVRESDFKFLAFNAGARRCTGREFGYWQMKWAAASILVRYQVKIVDEHPVVPKYGLSLYMKYGLHATIHQREKDEVIENEKGKGSCGKLFRQFISCFHVLFKNSSGYSVLI